jgi:hypothetical protein
MKRVKTLFKQAARHKKPWRCEEYLKKINNIRPASHKFIRKAEIMQENLPTEGHEITETAITNLLQLRKCQLRNSIMRS